MVRNYETLDASELLELLQRTERDRDSYQAQVHKLTERINNMTSAAASAAGVAESALGRLIRAEPVIKAAYALASTWNDSYPRTSRDLMRTLVNSVKEHQKGEPS